MNLPTVDFAHYLHRFTQWYQDAFGPWTELSDALDEVQRLDSEVKSLRRVCASASAREAQLVRDLDKAVAFYEGFLGLSEGVE